MLHLGWLRCQVLALTESGPPTVVTIRTGRAQKLDRKFLIDPNRFGKPGWSILVRFEAVAMVGAGPIKIRSS